MSILKSIQPINKMAVALEQVGGYDYQWITEPPDELKCAICISVARDPQQHGGSGCGKVFCSSCLKEYGRTSCPICRLELTLFQDVRSKLVYYMTINQLSESIVLL